MKEFDLELAKAGHPVQTRDGRKARIICFDMMDIYGYPIIALVKDEDISTETPKPYHINGRYSYKEQSRHDLVMADEIHEGWVNIYLDTDRNIPYCCEWIFPTKEDAEKHDNSADRKIATTKITWIEE